MQGEPRSFLRRPLRLAAVALALWAAAPEATAQTCTAGATFAAQCLGRVADVQTGIFRLPDGRDARALTFAHIRRGYRASPMAAVNQSYNGNTTRLFYGGTSTATECPDTSAPRAAFGTSAEYAFADHRIEDAANRLDCWNIEIDRYRPDGSRVADNDTCCYEPWNGAIYDLLGEANRVAVFPYTDHGPLPCESFEYSVWLSDNPDAREIAAAGSPDPAKWNPAVLTRVFEQGWLSDPAGTDPLNPNLSEPRMKDGFAMVYALPCGLTFRYAALVAGNLGSPDPACTFHSYDAEVDAVAGLNEDNTAVCLDRDGDGSRDMACGGGDCDDMDPTVHPGAAEDCSTPHDLDCDGEVPLCPEGTACLRGVCAPRCVEGACAEQFTCVSSEAGLPLCVPSPCADRECPAGQICGPRGCTDPCSGSACPVGQVCRGGACVDPCFGVRCPTHQHCDLDRTLSARCVPDCSCVPCAAGLACNAVTGRCEAADCASGTCGPGEWRHCTGTTARCVASCAEVTCPVGQVCEPVPAGPGRCVREPCFGVACPGGARCERGRCVRDEPPDSGILPAGPDAAVDPPPAMDASTTPDTDAGRRRVASDSACGCRTAGHAHGRGEFLSLGFASLLLSVLSRRRRAGSP